MKACVSGKWPLPWVYLPKPSASTNAGACTHVRDVLSTKPHDVRIRQNELAALGTELEGLISRSQPLNPTDCHDAKICNIIVPQHVAANPDLTYTPEP